MEIGVLGISFRSAPLHLRERLTRIYRERLELVPSPDLPSYVLLTTCNRAEVYFSGRELVEGHQDLLACLREGVTEPFEHALYAFFGVDCLNHLAQVAAGIDSAIVGESEIVRQVRHAYDATKAKRVLPAELHFAFQKALKIGKAVRTEHPHLSRSTSLEEGVATLLRAHGLQTPRLLLVGYSETSRKLIVFLQAKGMTDVTLCTKVPEIASSWCETHEVILLPREELFSWTEYDAVLGATYSDSYLITAEETPNALTTRLLMDLSMPRVFDPQLAKHPSLLTYHLDEVSALRQTSWEQTQREVENARHFVRQQAERQEFLWQKKKAHRLAADIF